QARHHALAPCGESLQQYLAVGLAHENMAGACELLPQIAKIVNFTVENDRVAPIGGAHGLLPRNQIDHGQASVAENGVAQVQQRTVVGPTRAQGIERSPGAVTPRRAYQADDSAHGLGMPRVAARVVPSKQVFVIAGSEESRSFPYVLSDQVETQGREQLRQFPRRNRLVGITADPVPDVVGKIHAALALVTGDM